VRIVFFGTPEFAIPTLKLLIDSQHEVVGVVTQPDRVAGRGRKSRPSPVKQEALKAGIRVIQPERTSNRAFIDDIKVLNPSAIVVVAYGQILKRDILDIPIYGCINVHASLLPKYRGAAPINWAIINGDTRTGVTIMKMDEGMDTGPILLQEEVQILPDDTAGSLSIKLSEIGARLLLKALDGLERGTLKPRPQTGEPSYAPMLKKEDGLIDWSWDSVRIFNFVRGMNPWPCAFTYLDGERIKILRVRPVAKDVGNQTDDPGALICHRKKELFVRCGDGYLSIIELQPEGRKVMTATAFIQGRRITEGSKFSPKI